MKETVSGWLLHRVLPPHRAATAPFMTMDKYLEGSKARISLANTASDWDVLLRSRGSCTGVQVCLEKRPPF